MKKKIIYIIGTGRSGTTLLEILVGNGKGIFNCGELNRYPKRRAIPPLYSTHSDKYIFWKNIANHINLSEEALTQQESLHKKYEYHSGLLKYWSGFSNTKQYQAYSSFLQKLYSTIFNHIDENIITDSSKYPGRALHLSKSLTDYDISYIYIKRDPVNVVKSFAKKDIEQPSKGWLPANMYYFVVNFLCTLMAKKLRKKHQVVEVKYETLINQPQEILMNIQQALDIDLSTVIEKIQEDEALTVGYLFDGNRIRLKNTIKLKTDTKPRRITLLDNVTRAVNYCFYH